MRNTGNVRVRRWGIPPALALAALTLAGAAASANFRTAEETTPRGGGDAASANFRLAGTFPQSAAGPLATSTNFRLDTDLVPDKFLPDDLIPPVITAAPTVIYLGHNRALVEWQTDELADGVVEYGLTAAYGSSVFQTGYSTLHQVLVTGLTAATAYSFRVGSMDQYRNGPTFSANGTFNTLAAADVAAPVVSAPVVTPTSTTSADITFTTSEAASTDVRHGSTAALGQTAPDGAFRTSHTRSLNGLPEGSQYFYAIDAADPSGNAATGVAASFNLPAAISFTTTALPGATKGKTYSFLVGTAGGLGASSVVVVSGTLPGGVTLTSSNGQLFGEPQAAGVYTFTLRAADSGTPASTADQVFTLSVGNAKDDSSDGGCAAGAGALPLPLIAVAVLRRRRRG